MLSNYIPKWEQKRLMLPMEFQRQRIIGGVLINLPAPPKQSEILNYKKPINLQKWETPTILTDKQFNDLSNNERVEFLSKEYEKRRNGVFFYNNGGIEYITGIHYFYLAYWKSEGVGLPEFRDSDRDFYYFWDAAEKDDNCYGVAYFTNRRSGKTMLATNIIYEYTSRTKEVHSGIQSQTNKDAKNVFRKIIFSWRKLPIYWKPKDSGETNPKESLKFEEPSIRSSKGADKSYTTVLDSLIDFASSGENAYDGYALYRYYCDEFGKFLEGNAYDRWNVVKPCLRVGSRIRGKAVFTTTVEELEKGGGRAAYDMYKDSNPIELQEDKRTKSGLWALFKPAYYGYEGYIDEYGYSDIDGAKKQLLSERKGREGKELSAITRKYPFTIKEAFQSSLSGGTFSSFKINQQKEFNATNGIKPRVGRFIWENRDELKVKFVDDTNGNCEISWLPKEEDWNKVSMINGLPSPTDKSLIFGVDSFDHRTTVDEEKYSKGANVGFKKYNVLEPNNSNSFFFKYLDRPPKETIFYDDVIKASVFYSAEFLHENNKPTIGNYSIDNGFKHYVMRTQQGDYTKSNSRNWVSGVSTAGEIVREAMIGNLESYIYDYIGVISPQVQRDKFGIAENEINPNFHGQCMFEEMLDDWEKFTSTKWTDYDITVASMIALLGAYPIRKKKQLIIEENTLSLESLFKIHKLR